MSRLSLGGAKRSKPPDSCQRCSSPDQAIGMIWGYPLCPPCIQLWYAMPQFAAPVVWAATGQDTKWGPKTDGGISLVADEYRLRTRLWIIEADSRQGLRP